jgi:RNA polymerase sigma-70 factor (ECF subfamily)
LEEAHVIALMRAGSINAFAEIVERYQMPIIRHLYRLTGDYEMAQDLAQDTFLQAYKSILKTTADISLKAWLYRIATNNARQYRRRKRLLSFISFDDYRKSDTLTMENQSDLTGDKMAIQEALLKVPEVHRVCMVLHFIEGFKYREIAETLGVSEDTVRKRVARGSREFRRQYNAGGGEVHEVH